MSTTTRPRLSPSTLLWARKVSGFQTEEVAKSAGVTLERYLEWELGDDRPTFRQLRQVANKLKRPLALFYLENPPIEPSLPPDFRVVPGGENSTYSPELRLEIRKAERLQMLVGVLREQLGLPDIGQFPNIAVALASDSAAETIRNHLNFSVSEQLGIGEPSVLYREWRDKVFQSGVLPIQFGIDRDQALGFALWHDYAPTVAVNTRQSPEAKTFTLLHEVAHIALRMPGVSDASIPFREYVTEQSQTQIESYCNQVAASILLPKDSNEVQETMKILESDRSLQTDTFKKHARRFGVSKYALAYRFKSLRPSYEDQVQSLVSNWFALDNSRSEKKEKKKGGPPPALTTLGKRGSGFAKVVLTAVRESRISTEEARDLLDLEAHHFSKLEEYVFKGNALDDGGDE